MMRITGLLIAAALMACPASASSESTSDTSFAERQAVFANMMGELSALAKMCPSSTINHDVLRVLVLMVDSRHEDIEKGGRLYKPFRAAFVRFSIAYGDFDERRACERAKLVFGGDEKSPGLLKFPSEH
jgi:predicted secreted protein